MGELKLGKHRLRTPAVCGAVMGQSPEEMERVAARAVKQGADLIELRFDSLRKSRGWEKLLQKNLPIIFTNRPKREGGGFSGTEAKRVALILDAISLGADCVDIELSTPKKLRDRVISEARRSGAAVIMSQHDFSKTPLVEELAAYAKDLQRTGCDVAKVVTLANDATDAFRVLDFLVRVQDEVDVPVISFAMGEAGRITRILAAFLGSPITYASAGKPTAPGQLDVAQTKLLLRQFARARGKR